MLAVVFNHMHSHSRTLTVPSSKISKSCQITLAEYNIITYICTAQMTSITPVFELVSISQFMVYTTKESHRYIVH